MSTTDEFQIFLRELQRINDVKQLNPKTGNNGATNITTPQAGGNVNHGTQILPQETQGTNGTDEIIEKTQPGYVLKRCIGLL